MSALTIPALLLENQSDLSYAVRRQQQRPRHTLRNAGCPDSFALTRSMGLGLHRAYGCQPYSLLAPGVSVSRSRGES